MKEIALITGSAGLIGAEAVRFMNDKFDNIVGIDNNMRLNFFGEEASTDWCRKNIESEIPNYIHYDTDIRNEKQMEYIFKRYNSDDDNKIKLIIHTAAQPSHDWASRHPIIDFTINANGTLNLLEMTRQYCPDATFIFTSSNKIYGDTPNTLPLTENENTSRYEIDSSHRYYKNGIDESMSIDNSKHSLYGCSKLSADILVQEYGKYYNMKTASFRAGCLTGSGHSSTELHGFLAYLMKCIINQKNYNIFGYKGKQVRDNIHSYDLVNAFWNFYQNPRKGIGEVYNIGGGRDRSCSILEAINMCEEISGEKIKTTYVDKNRIGDHIWWISDNSKFQSHYPEWKFKYSLKDILIDIYNNSNFNL